MTTSPTFDLNCTACQRLDRFLRDIRKDYPGYHARPVAPFGADNAHLLIVGLAPGMHGANASGRPFTGDYAGILLYETLHEFGFASAPESVSQDDGLVLHNCRITNAVKCLPPQNKPTTDEIRMCNPYLANELAGLPKNSVVVALGKIAHDAIIRALGLKLSSYKFAHAAEHCLDNFILLNSYHCSRYNTQTRRLTDKMFKKIFARVQVLLN